MNILKNNINYENNCCNKDLLNFIKKNDLNNNDPLNNVMAYGGQVNESYLTTFNENNPLIIAIDKKNERVLDMLLSICKSLNLDLNNLNGRYEDSLIHHAIISNNSKILLKVLSYPIRIDIFDEHSYNTPLHEYCKRFKSPEDCQEILNLMIEKTNDLNRINAKGKTPLHKAVLNNSIRVMLVSSLVEKHHARITVFNYHDYSPLHYSIKLGRCDLILKLLKNGADLSAQQKNGISSYQLAIQLDQPNVLKLIKNYLNLSSWLDKHQLSQYFLCFLKRDILNENGFHLSEITEDLLNDIGIPREKILFILKIIPK